MPLVPSSCADIIRSAAAGPRRTQIKPSARSVSTKPATAIKKLAIVSSLSQGPPEEVLVFGQLRHDRLAYVEAVNQDYATLI